MSISARRLDEALVSFAVVFDFHRDLCERGIHPDSPFHPIDCPESRPSVGEAMIPDQEKVLSEE